MSLEDKIREIVEKCEERYELVLPQRQRNVDQATQQLLELFEEYKKCLCYEYPAGNKVTGYCEIHKDKVK